jgi:hypothetical protein
MCRESALKLSSFKFFVKTNFTEGLGLFSSNPEKD